MFRKRGSRDPSSLQEGAKSEKGLCNGLYLVRAVEKCDVLLRLHKFGKLRPLVFGWVHARGVVRTSVQQKH